MTVGDLPGGPLGRSAALIGPAEQRLDDGPSVVGEVGRVAWSGPGNLQASRWSWMPGSYSDDR